MSMYFLYTMLLYYTPRRPEKQGVVHILNLNKKAMYIRIVMEHVVLRYYYTVSSAMFSFAGR